MAIKDTTTACFTCDSLQLYLDQAQGFASNLGTALSGPLEHLLFSLIALWATVTGIKMLVGSCSLVDLVKEALFIGLAASLFKGQGGATIISDIYNAALSIMGGASQVAFEVAGGTSSGGYSGIPGLAASGEKAVARVIEVANAITLKATAFSIGAWVGAILLLLPYIVLILTYVGQVAVGIFRLMALACFGPFLLICFAFSWGRQMTMAGLKACLASILVLFASTVALAMAISGVNALDLSGASSDAVAFASFTNGPFWAAIAIGWMTIAFMAESAAISNTITGTFLSNQAAMVIKGAMAATGLAALQAGGRFLGNAGSAIQEASTSHAARTDQVASLRDQLLERYRSVNNTPS